MTNMERFAADYPAALARAMEQHPDDYMQGLSADTVAAKMIRRIAEAGQDEEILMPMREEQLEAIRVVEDYFTNRES